MGVGARGVPPAAVLLLALADGCQSGQKGACACGPDLLGITSADVERPLHTEVADPLLRVEVFDAVSGELVGAGETSLEPTDSTAFTIPPGFAVDVSNRCDFAARLTISVYATGDTAENSSEAETVTVSSVDQVVVVWDEWPVRLDWGFGCV